MNCSRCGASNGDTAPSCVQCGQPLGHAPPPGYGAVGYPPGYRPQQIGDDAGMRMLLPVGRSGLAILAGYLGLLSCFGFFAPVALLIGILAVRDIKQNPEKHGMGRAIFAIVMGGLGTLGLVIWLVTFIFAPS
jgi:Domain of unknown function (DUF4190)